MFFLKFIIDLFLLFIFVTPQIFLKSNKNNKIIARVGAKYLYQSDLSGIIDGFNEKAKISRTKQFVNEWIKKHLIISEAKKNKAYNDIEVERKVLDYKYELIIHDFIERSIKDIASSDISDEDIEKYYNDNISNFELKENIVKGRFAIIPRTAPNSNNLINLFLSSKEKKGLELKEYCKNNSKSYFLDSSTWIKFDDMIDGTPLEDSRDKMRTIKRMKKKKINKFIGKDNIYYFEVIDYKISNEVSPLEFVKEKIKDIIIHRNEIELQKKLLNEILEKAKKRRNYEIFI